jgi:predicted glutamine amidotransferase
MCFILSTYYLQEEHIELINQQWKDNPHGAGIAFIDDNKLTITKGIMTRSFLNKCLKSHLYETVIVHLRFATHGNKDIDNTHPFLTCSGGAAMAHNGILPSPWSSSGSVSDSRMMAETLSMLKVIDIVRDSAQIGYQIGHNKLVFLSKEGFIHIINHELGEWIEKGKTWISNRITPFHSTDNWWNESKYDKFSSSVSLDDENLKRTERWMMEEAKKEIEL